LEQALPDPDKLKPTRWNMLGVYYSRIIGAVLPPPNSTGKVPEVEK